MCVSQAMRNSRALFVPQHAREPEARKAGSAAKLIAGKPRKGEQIHFRHVRPDRGVPHRISFAKTTMGRTLVLTVQWIQ